MGWIWILAAIVVLVAAVAAWLAFRPRRSPVLRELGLEPESGRSHARLDIRELAPQDREQYASRWQRVQRHFVDEPVRAVGAADNLVREVMHARGYPVDDDFERRAADISVDHPEVVRHYRVAHEISVRTTRRATDREDLRQAMVHFRALFGELLLGPRVGDPGRVRGER
jgi:hypothetical protein